MQMAYLYISYFAIVVVILNSLRALWYHHIQPYFERRKLMARSSKHTQQAKQKFDLIYRAINGKKISKHWQRQQNNHEEEYIYGEIDFLSFAELLAKSHAKPGDIFMDLGAGTGKAVIAAALLLPFQQCIGIELLTPLYESSQQNLQALMALNYQHASIAFEQNNFLEIDLSRANILFINATAFRNKLWQRLYQKLQNLPPKTDIIITSHRLPAPQFKPIYQGFCLMSWGKVRTGIYRKQ